MSRQRYLIAGTGVRALCFAKALVRDFTDVADLAGLYDLNPLRMAGFQELLGVRVPAGTDFTALVRDVRPTHLIVTTPDATHDELIAMGFAHGLDVICEKPLTIDAPRVRRILALERDSGRRLTVAFNYRFTPYAARVRQLVRDGAIGAVRAVSLDWQLDKLHGAEYFRRWHAHMASSGGLFVHKATHHFDLVNWIIADDPEAVMAQASLRVYGRNGTLRGERCSTCPHAAGACPFPMRTHQVPKDAPIYDQLYWRAEAGDGYLRDRCVFRPEIDIYDTMTALVRYRRGAQLAYSLNAYSPVEGYRLVLTGDTGRLEASETHAGIAMAGHGGENQILIYRGTTRDDQTREVVPVRLESGDHGGGDARLYTQLFRPGTPDPLGQVAGARAGAMSCLVGIAANLSAVAGRTVTFAELLGAAP